MSICESKVVFFFSDSKKRLRNMTHVVSGIPSDDHNVSSAHDSEISAMFLLFSVNFFLVYEKSLPIVIYSLHYISYLSNIS